MNFFEQQWNNFYQWFITNSGWLTIARDVIILLLELIIIKIVLHVLKRGPKHRKSKMSSLARSFLVSTVKIVLYFVFIMTILSMIGVNISNIVTIISALSVAISFALSEVATNFASGLILITNKPFNEGDYIASNGVEGTVISTAMFSTRLLTPDNKVVVIPNAILATNGLTNYSAMPERRVDLKFSVDYGSDVAKVQSVMKKVLDEHKQILHEKGYNLRLVEQGSSAITFHCRFWVETKNYWDVYFDINEFMFLAFRENDIVIPYNKLDVNLFTENK